MIIEERQLRALELPRLQVEDIRSRAQTLSNPDIADTELLEWLWDTIAMPFLDLLGFSKPPTDTWPRVWWIPTGPLAQLPIHAAGYHTNGSSDTVLDRVISSYSSSVRALVISRQNRLVVPRPRAREKMVLIGMAQTQGYKPLHFASHEVEALVSIGSSMQLQVVQPLPNRKAVLSVINDCIPLRRPWTPTAVTEAAHGAPSHD